jgi:hypothetical protein
MSDRDPLLSFSDIGRLTGKSRQQVWHDARIRSIATKLAPSQTSGPTGSYRVALSQLNAALGLSIAPTAALAARQASQADLLSSEPFEFTEEC